MRLATKSMRLIVLMASIFFAGLAIQGFAGVSIKKPISTGKDFFIVFPKAAWGNQSVGILINSPSKQKITVTTPSGAKGSVNITQAKYTQYYAGQFRIESEPGVVKKSEATRIQSPNPISIHGQFGVAGISGTFTAIPVSAWGLEYYAICPQEGTNQDYWYYPTIYSVPMITIIGSHQGTNVTITPTANTSTGQPANTPFNITLNTGDVYNMTTAGDPKAIVRVEDPCEADFTGTHIESTFPVGVLCAQSHSTWPCGYNECGDYCVEYIPPVCNWDSLYLVTPSVPRLGGLAGEQLRIVFGHDGTDLIIDDGLSTPRDVGTYSAGQWIDYPSPIQNAVILAGTHPFLPVEFTTKPAACQAGTSGGENWTLGMVVMTGVNQWGDYTPYSTAIGSQSVANICFRYKDAKHLNLNGKPLIEQFPTIKLLQQGFATIPISINGGSYNELTGDSGATAGGSIFGFGTLRFSPNDGGSGGNHTQDPEVIKSFCHPIGVDALPACNPDVTPPHDTIVYNCGHWDVTAMDDEIDPPATGLYDVYLATNNPPDTSFNVQFNPAPVFGYGDTRSNTFGIDVINLAQGAQASLHLRDGAGNEYDTLLVYNPQKVNESPALCDVGAVRSGSSTFGFITLYNPNSTPVTFASYRLKYGASHHWKFVYPPTPNPPFTILPGDSAVFKFEYDSPTTQNIEFDNDTLFVTTCKEFPIAALLGQPKKPAMFTQCYDFGNLTIDSPPYDGGDTASSGKGVWVTSVGSDTLHISGVHINGTIAPADPTFPASDYWFGKYHKINLQRVDSTLAAPTVAMPWQIAPSETVFVEVFGHPHHGGPRGMGSAGDNPTNNAYVLFDNDAGGILQDSACLTMVGQTPGLEAKGIDYGTHLYATTMDSFFVVRNNGQVLVSIIKNGFDYGTSPDHNSFAFHQYKDPVTQSNIQYDTTTNLDLYPADTTRGLPGDTVRVPYRFIANQLGALIDSITIGNTSPTPSYLITLKGKVIQPHVTGVGNCSTDSVYLGGTATQTIKIGNQGTDVLTIEQINPSNGGMIAPTVRPQNWTLTSIVSSTGATLQLPFGIVPNDSVTATLTFVPDTIGPVTASVQIIGSDALHRHAADSSASPTYAWVTPFPYDTTVQVCNAGFANGIAASNLHLEQYVTLTKTDTIWIKNTGQGPIDVTDINAVGTDFSSTESFVTFVTASQLPITIPSGQSSPIIVQFAPQAFAGQPITSGRRNYQVDFVITNSTGTPITAHFTGRGHGVDLHSYIPITYNIATPGGNDPATTYIIIDKYADTLGQADIQNFVMEMIHYRRSVVQANVPWDVANGSSNSVGTTGATFQENHLEDTQQDSAHLNGTQGYLELNVSNTAKNILSNAPPFNLMAMQFIGLLGLDTSQLVYVLKNFGDANGTILDYVNATQDFGVITVDSICGLNVTKVTYKGPLSLNQNAPNPFPGTTNISFSQPFSGHVKLTVVNTVGDIVGTPLDQELTSGTFNVKFDASGLPNGLYTYRLETGSGSMQKQMLLMR